MATGYATIANGGVTAEPYLIERVESRDGEELYSHEDVTRRALSEDVASDVSYALQQVVQSGSGTEALALDRPAAGKTGTATRSDGAVSSSWFAGYTPQLSTAVMMVRGRGQGQLDGWVPTSSDGKEGYFGGNYPAKAWTAIMGRDLEGAPVEEFPAPAFVDGDADSSDSGSDDDYVPPPAPAPEPTQPPQQAPPTRAPSPSPIQPSPTQPAPTQPSPEEPSPSQPTPGSPDNPLPPTPAPSPSRSPGAGGDGGRDGGGARDRSLVGRAAYPVGSR